MTSEAKKKFAVIPAKSKTSVGNSPCLVRTKLNTSKIAPRAPINENKEIIPQLFFVPCLGFDLKGYRIGYGGGFYDKTFEKLKKLNLSFNTVGFAYDDQKHNELPIEKFDYKLDFVLTEKQLYTFL